MKTYLSDGRVADDTIGADVPASSPRATAAVTPPAKPVDAAPAPKESMSAFSPKGVSAKAFQSATFGVGDKLLSKVDPQLGHAIKEISAQYDDQHPLASFGIDLAVAGATMAVPGLDAVSSGRALASGARLVGERAVGKAAMTSLADSGVGRAASAIGGSTIGKGAAYGATQGAVQGAANADPGDRVSGALSGAAKSAGIGAVGGAALGAAGNVVKRVAGTANNVFRTAPAANSAILAALRSDGKTVEQLTKFVDENPNARIADFSPAVARLTGEAGKTNPKNASALSGALRRDAAGQGDRILAPDRAADSQATLQRVRADAVDNIEKLKTQADDLYSKSRSEITPISKELKSVLNHEDVAPLVAKSLKAFGIVKQDASSDIAKAPKYKVGAEIPSAVLDDVAKGVGKLADSEGKGSTRYGALIELKKQLQAGQTGSLPLARGAYERQAAAQGDHDAQIAAQTWGNRYAFGLGSAKIEDFRAMTPDQKANAKLGMVGGLEKYLRDHSSMPAGALSAISAKLKDPAIVEVLGQKSTNDVRMTFEKEAARARNNALMAQGGKEAKKGSAVGAELAGHLVAHAAPGPVHWMVRALSVLANEGMSADQARNVIHMATQPGGMTKLKQAGLSSRAIAALYAQRGAIGGRAAAQEDQERDDRNSRLRAQMTR